jgi:hypothetical protein
VRLTRRALFALVVSLLVVPSLSAYRIFYAEQFYELYHLHLHQYPDDTMENIVWLQQALQADFANPLNALARIETDEEWDYYQDLFRMHVNVLLAQLHMTLGSKFDKRHARFFNAPWAWANLESLDHAETAYHAARAYWSEALTWSDAASAQRRPGLHLPRIQAWEDQNYRIEFREFDYDEIIDENLDRLFDVRAEFLAMDETTY